ncbi:MAG: RHS repeat protein [Burkholderiales bacterium]|nr:MAG: RHS repeat protein [Burkholderiales bacterium]
MLRVFLRAFLFIIFLPVFLTPSVTRAEPPPQCWVGESIAGAVEWVRSAVPGCQPSPEVWMAKALAAANQAFNIAGPSYPTHWLTDFRVDSLPGMPCVSEPVPVVYQSRYICAYVYVLHERYYEGGAEHVRDNRGGFVVLRQVNQIPEETLIAVSGSSPLFVGESGVARAAVTQNGAPVAGASVSFGGLATCTGQTNASGVLECRFTAGDMPGNYPVDATCTACSNSASTIIRVLGLPDPPPASCPAGGPGPANGSFVGNPIRTATGVKSQLEVDFTDPGQHPLHFSRTFRSDRVDPGSVGRRRAPAGLGNGWRHSFSMGLHNADGMIQLEMEDGSTVTFRYAENGPLGGYWQPLVGNDKLENSASGDWIYRRASDDSTWLYSAAALVSITARNGWTTTFARNAEGRLSRVTNHFGRSIAFIYTPNGWLASVTLPDGQSVAYAADSAERLVQVTNADGTRKSYIYELPGSDLLTGIIDENGARYATFIYDNAGRATSTEHAGGVERFTVAYGGPLRSVGTPLGARHTLQISVAAGVALITGSSQPIGGQGTDAAARVQNPDGTMFSETDFLGVTRRLSWNARQLPLSVTDAAGTPEERTVNTVWHDVLRLPLSITSAGLKIDYTYDTLGRKSNETWTDIVSGQSRVTAWTYTARGLVETMKDARGGVWRYGWDAAGNHISTTNPVGLSASQAYDPAGRLVLSTAFNGLTTTFAYDARGRLSEESAAGEITRYGYTPAGQVSAVKFANGYSVVYAYDAARRLIAVIDNRGNAVRYTLDSAGNRIREEVKDRSGTLASVTSRVIDSMNRVTAVQNATGQTTQFSYDANGAAVATTDPLNQTTRRALDGLGREIAVTFADGASVAQAWDPLDQLTQVTDPKGVRTQYTRNAFGDVLSETSPDIGTIRYTRNAAGDVLSIQDAKGQITSILRDALGRPTEIRYAADRASFFSYDAAGYVVRMEDGSGVTTFERDSMGRITIKKQGVSDDRRVSPNATVYYRHEGGDLSHILYPSGLNVFYRRTNGRITGIDLLEPSNMKIVRTPAPFVTDIAWTSLEQPKSWAWHSGDKAARIFDADGRMTSSEIATYTHDAASRITGITQNLYAKGTGSASGGTTPYVTSLAFTAGYDARNRLVSLVRAGAETRYTYDANSNRLSAIDTVTSDTDLDNAFDAVDLASTTSQALNVELASNTLLGFQQTVVRTSKGVTKSTVVTPVNYTVDENGAMTSDGLRTFEYDAAQRLSKVKVLKNGEAASVSYEYNALGQRVFKGEYQAEQTLPRQANLGSGFIAWLKTNFGWLYADAKKDASIGTAYLYGDDASEIPAWALLGEYDNGTAKGAGRTEYIWLPVPGGQAIPIGMYRNGQLYAIHSDHLGTPRLMTDEARAVVWQWPYSAFGNNKPTGVLKATAKPKGAVTQQPVLFEATAAVEMNLRMPGQYADSETGEFYNYFRQYDAKTGRYSRPDPIGLEGAVNRFAYVNSDPLAGVDASGLQPRGVPPPGGPGANLRWPSVGPNEPAPSYRVNEQSRSRGNLSETTVNLLNTFSANANGPITIRVVPSGNNF